MTLCNSGKQNFHFGIFPTKLNGELLKLWKWTFWDIWEDLQRVTCSLEFTWNLSTLPYFTQMSPSLSNHNPGIMQRWWQLTKWLKMTAQRGFSFPIKSSNCSALALKLKRKAHNYSEFPPCWFSMIQREIRLTELKPQSHSVSPWNVETMIWMMVFWTWCTGDTITFLWCLMLNTLFVLWSIKSPEVSRF